MEISAAKIIRQSEAFSHIARDSPRYMSSRAAAAIFRPIEPSFSPFFRLSRKIKGRARGIIYRWSRFARFILAGEYKALRKFTIEGVSRGR